MSMAANFTMDGQPEVACLISDDDMNKSFVNIFSVLLLAL